MREETLNNYMDNLELGKRIAEFRKRDKLTIKQLAEKVQVTSSLLSQIERGLASPSLNTLRVIANALDVPMFNFFTTPVNAKDLIVRADSRKKILFPAPQNLEYILLSPDLNGVIEMVLMKLSPQSLSSIEPMRHIGEEVAYVLNGSITLYLGAAVETLYAGDSVKIPPNLQHKWENQTDSEVSIIFAVTPPSF